MGRYKRRRYRRIRRAIPWFKGSFGANNKLVWIVLAVILLIALLIYSGKIIYSSDTFKVKKIKTNVELSRKLEKSVMGKSLFTVDTQEIYSQMKLYYPESKEIYVLKEFPSSLKILVKMRRPVVQIKKDKFYPVDKEGIIVSNGKREEIRGLIPVELGSNKINFRKSEKIEDQRLEYVFDLIKELEKFGFMDNFSIEAINASSLQALSFFIKDKRRDHNKSASGVKVIIGNDGFQHKLYLFDNVLKEQLNDDISTVKYIDLRYKKVYLGFER
jgi:cell division septal protein FtsQ